MGARVSRRSAWLLAAVTLWFVGVCVAPSVIAAARTPPDKTFTGLLVNPYDNAYYLAAQRSAAEDLVNTNRFTPEADAPGPVAQLYPFLGKIGAATGIDPLVLYHAPRVLSALLLPFLVFWLMRLCFPGDDRRAMIGVVLTLFSVGLPTLVPALSMHTPIADELPEATVMYSFAAFPHFAVAYTGITLGFITLLLAWRDAGGRKVAASGAATGLLLAVSHAFLLLPLVLTAALATAVSGAAWVRGRAPRSRPAKLVLAQAAVLIPAMPFLVTLKGEMDRFKALQGASSFPATPLDHWWALPSAYAILMPLAMLGLVALLQHRRADGSRQGAPDTGAVGLLLIGFVVQALLMLTPLTPFQRRFSEGAALPLAALAALGIAVLGRYQSRAVALLAVGSCTLAVAGAAQYAEYVPKWRADLFAHIGQADIVLAGDEVAAQLPAYSSGAVLLGRGVETIQYVEKQTLRQAFAANPYSDEVLERLRAEGVNLVLVDDADPSFVPAEPLEGPCFPPAFAVGSITAVRLVTAGSVACR